MATVYEIHEAFDRTRRAGGGFPSAEIGTTAPPEWHGTKVEILDVIGPPFNQRTVCHCRIQVLDIDEWETINVPPADVVLL